MNPLQEKIKEVKTRNESELLATLTHQRELAEYERQYSILRKEIILPAYNEAIVTLKEARDSDFDTISSDISWKIENDDSPIQGDFLEVESNGNPIVQVWIYSDQRSFDITMNFRSRCSSEIVTDKYSIGKVTRNEILKFIAECYSKSC